MSTYLSNKVPRNYNIGSDSDCVTIINLEIVVGVRGGTGV